VTPPARAPVLARVLMLLMPVPPSLLLLLRGRSHYFAVDRQGIIVRPSGRAMQGMHVHVHLERERDLRIANWALHNKTIFPIITTRPAQVESKNTGFCPENAARPYWVPAFSGSHSVSAGK
jgi:hypothetical protein